MAKIHPLARHYRVDLGYYDWLIDRIFLLVPAQVYVGNFLKTFKEFPLRQEAASFSLDKVMKQIMTSTGSK